MWKKKKRRVTKVDSLVGQNTQVTGDFHFRGGLHVDGNVKGNVSSEDDDTSVLSLSDRGTIEGEVRVPYVILNGVVVGDVYASQHIELASSARVEGNVYYKVLEMAAGAQINGKMLYRDEAPRQLSRPELVVAEA